MGRDAFERLMGPAEEILQKEIAEYERQNADIAKQTKQPSSEGKGKAGAKGKQASSAKNPSRGSKVKAETGSKEAGSSRKYSLL